MSAAKRLADLGVGETGVVHLVEGEGAFRRRLMELGLLSGTPVRVVRVAPLRDPMELEVRHASLSIRRADALRVLLQPGEQPQGGRS